MIAPVEVAKHARIPYLILILMSNVLGVPLQANAFGRQQLKKVAHPKTRFLPLPRVSLCALRTQIAKVVLLRLVARTAEPKAPV